MITIAHTCIKKGKGIYKNSLTSTLTVATEETPNEQPTNNPIPVYPDHTDSDNPDFDDAPLEIDSPDYSQEELDQYWKDFDEECDQLTEKDYHILRNSFFENDNPHDTILESTYFEDSDKLVVFGVPPRGDLLNQYCLWQYQKGITNLITIGKKEAVKLRYEDYCKDEKAFFILPKPTTPYLEEFKTRLEPDGRYFPKKQLSLFGEK